MRMHLSMKWGMIDKRQKETINRDCDGWLPAEKNAVNLFGGGWKIPVSP